MVSLPVCDTESRCTYKSRSIAPCAATDKREGDRESDSWSAFAMLAQCAQRMEAKDPAACSRDDACMEDLNSSRKERSLRLLCDKFLRLYSASSEVSLDEASKKLGVERRRMYDIINVLESFDVVYRKSKNRYAWLGLDQIRSTLRQHKLRGPPKDDFSDGDDNSDSEAQSPASTGCSQGSATPKIEARREKKCLASLCQRFVNLFLHAKDGVVSLEFAARCLTKEQLDECRLRTKIRRLYDVANILSSLNLIEKTVKSAENRKPAFRWIFNIEEEQSESTHQQNVKGESGQSKSWPSPVKRTAERTTCAPDAKRRRAAKLTDAPPFLDARALPGTSSPVTAIGLEGAGAADASKGRALVRNSEKTAITLKVEGSEASKSLETLMKTCVSQLANMQDILSQIAQNQVPKSENSNENGVQAQDCRSEVQNTTSRIPEFIGDVRGAPPYSAVLGLMEIEGKETVGPVPPEIDSKEILGEWFHLVTSSKAAGPHITVKGAYKGVPGVRCAFDMNESCDHTCGKGESTTTNDVSSSSEEGVCSCSIVGSEQPQESEDGSCVHESSDDSSASTVMEFGDAEVDNNPNQEA